MTNLPAFNQPVDLWLADGSLRDIYIFDTVEKDWDAFLELARSQLHTYTLDGLAQPLPGRTTVFQDREHSHLLSIQAGSVKINCHFFIPEEIELDIDPTEINGEEEHVAVLQFIEQISEATSRDVVVTQENSPDLVLLRYEQTRNSWQTYESHSNSDAKCLSRADKLQLTSNVALKT